MVSVDMRPMDLKSLQNVTNNPAVSLMAGTAERSALGSNARDQFLATQGPEFQSLRAALSTSNPK